ncbi:MAG: hypothetical protein U7127_03045 [Phormidium sp.]
MNFREVKLVRLHDSELEFIELKYYDNLTTEQKSVLFMPKYLQAIALSG